MGEEMDGDATVVSYEVIAEIVADYLLAQLPSWRVYHLSVLHEVRPRELRRLERIRQRNPDYRPGEPTGPCRCRTTGRTRTSSAFRPATATVRGGGPSTRRSLAYLCFSGLQPPRL